MTKLLDEAIKKVRALPDGEQDAAAGALLDYVSSLHDLELTDEQLAEVRRRRGRIERTTISLVEVRERLSRRGA